jgi:hypothetical protein
MLGHTQRTAEDALVIATNAIIGLEDALPKITDTSGENFRMTIQGRFYDSRAEAAHALGVWAGDTSDLRWVRNYVNRDYGVIGQISGFDITLSVHPGLSSPQVQIGLATNTRHNTRDEPLPVPKAAFSLSRETFLEAGVGLITRIENRVSGIPHLLELAQADRDAALRASADAKGRMGKPFKHADALLTAEADYQRITALLAASQRTRDHEPTPAPPPAAPTSPRPPLSVERVRAYQPPPGLRADPARTPSDFPIEARQSSTARPPARGL